MRIRVRAKPGSRHKNKSQPEEETIKCLNRLKVLTLKSCSRKKIEYKPEKMEINNGFFGFNSTLKHGAEEGELTEKPQINCWQSVLCRKTRTIIS